MNKSRGDLTRDLSSLQSTVFFHVAEREGQFQSQRQEIEQKQHRHCRTVCLSERGVPSVDRSGWVSCVFFVTLAGGA
jgi:hypothetical protein